MTNSITKSQAERAVRHLIGNWIHEIGIGSKNAADTQFEDFKEWVDAKGDSYIFEFRSVRGPLEDAELWFDQETNQVWKR